MISVQEAKLIIKNNVHPLASVLLPLNQLSNLVLAEEIRSPIDLPPFEQSNMDGYAFNYNDYPSNPIMITGEVQAGGSNNIPLSAGQAVRIFTGASLPPQADTVVMQEKVQVKDTSLTIQDEQLLRGTNVRPKGSEIRAGALALETGTFLSPAAIGFLAAMGIQQAKVYPHPSISILITGKEIRKPGEQLRPGEVYDANSFILHAALNRIGMDKIDMVFVDDELELVQHALSDALLRSDLVLLTGGISVGDYDFVLRAANACGVQQYFHSVKQKPGKPLFFGKKADKLVFGLPGNPSSVLTCFYEYVIPALEGMTRRAKILRTAMLPMAKNYSKKAGLTHFLKARVVAGSVSPLDAQESYRLSSFAQSDALIVLEEDRTDWKAGDLVEVHFID